VRLLGRGGMAEVYEANDGRLGRRVAVKVFRGETDIATSQARQQLEIRALARLQHPDIVAVFDAGADAGVSFLVMQLSRRCDAGGAHPRLGSCTCRDRPGRLGGL
jgi:serine/threonine protein kinase